MTGGPGIRLRQAEISDAPRLKALWKTVFGDPDAHIDHFFSVWFAPERTAVADDDRGYPAAMAYILPAGQLVGPGGARLACAMLYAIATRPDCRGRGLGGAVTQYAARLASDSGFPAVVLKPADDGLFEYYARRTGFSDYFTAVETVYTADGLPTGGPPYALSPVSAPEYGRLRNTLLAGSVYIDMDGRGLSYQAHLCTASGGGLFALTLDGRHVGCAAVEFSGGDADIHELLLAPGCRVPDAVAALSAHIPASQYAVRTPPACGGAGSGGERRFAMIGADTRLPPDATVHCVKWYGPAFD